MYHLCGSLRLADDVPKTSQLRGKGKLIPIQSCLIIHEGNTSTVTILLSQ